MWTFLDPLLAWTRRGAIRRRGGEDTSRKPDRNINPLRNRKKWGDGSLMEKRNESLLTDSCGGEVGGRLPVKKDILGSSGKGGGIVY